MSFTLSNTIKLYAKKLKTPVKINILDFYGRNRSKENLVRQSIFLKEELSIRLCHRVFDLLKLPYGLPIVPEIKNVVELYIHSFNRLIEFEKPNNLKKIHKFTNLVEDIKNNHNKLEESIALGIKRLDNPLFDYPLVNKELDTFFLSRIGIRTLISHQIATVKYDENLIQNKKIECVIDEVLDEAKFLSNRIYDFVPEIIVNDQSSSIVPYIEGHLYYIILEVLKNSIVAHLDNNVLDKPIKITIGEGSKDITIKISDYGLGFSYRQISKIMSYSYSTTQINGNTTNSVNRPIISGFGFGLPMAKIHSKYLGGNLVVNSIENIGTDVYIYIDKSGNQNERF